MRGGGQSYGKLIVNNGAVTGNKRTVLPSLGSGTAQAASAGAVLATGRSKAIAPYFVGHWVEVRDAATGTLKGTWRIASIGADGLAVTLAPAAGETVSVAGYTYSADFPTTPGAFDRSYNGEGDAFVATLRVVPPTTWR